ncbi:tryptophan-rich sensory protein [Rhodococcus aerolatus]
MDAVTTTAPAVAAGTLATAAVGGLAGSSADSPWFRSLDEPPFQPPAAVFPVVWTALYADTAVAATRVLDRLRAQGRDDEARAFATALAANLALNASWTWVFFRAHRLAGATVVAGALAASCADLARRADAASRPAAVALLPYAAWCTFATVLSATLWRRNRGR